MCNFLKHKTARRAKQEISLLRRRLDAKGLNLLICILDRVVLISFQMILCNRCEMTKLGYSGLCCLHFCTIQMTQ